MSTLKQTLLADMKTAMKDKDQVKKGVVNLIRAGIQNQILIEQLPKLEKDDSTTKKWVNVIKRIEMCMDKGLSPQSVEMQLIMDDMNILSEETFQGNQQLMNKFWEVRKSEKASKDLRLYPIKPAIIEFIEQALQVEYSDNLFTQR